MAWQAPEGGMPRKITEVVRRLYMTHRRWLSDYPQRVSCPQHSNNEGREEELFVEPGMLVLVLDQAMSLTLMLAGWDAQMTWSSCHLVRAIYRSAATGVASFHWSAG